MHDTFGLILDYQRTLKHTRALQRKQTVPEQETVVNGMISDLQYAIEWMKCGEDPERYLDVKADQSYYHRRVLLDMDKFPCLDIEPTHSRPLADKKKIIIQHVLSELTERQLTCYLLNAAHMRSYQEIAEELGIKKSTVQDHIELAREKIKRVIETI